MLAKNFLLNHDIVRSYFVVLCEVQTNLNREFNDELELHRSGAAIFSASDYLTNAPNYILMLFEKRFHTFDVINLH